MSVMKKLNKMKNLNKGMFLVVILLAVLIVQFVQPPQSAQAATFPTGFTETQLASGLSSLTAMAILPDGRVFVAQQMGVVRVFKNDALLPTPFISLADVNSEGERGLLGIAVDPNFATNRYVYLYSAVNTPNVHNRLMRVTANGDVANTSTLITLVDFPPIGTAIWHMGGAIHFGNDGKLYLAVGDHQIASDAQSLNTPFGKVHRFNPDGTIPSDNPFYTQTSGINRAIWSMGLRNPYTFAVQPGTSRVFINDVGNTSWEEINAGAAGANFGWPTTEGYHNDARYRSPIHAYPHGSGTNAGCSISGGTFYNPASNNFPSQYVGRYFFVDFCNGWLKILNPADNTVSLFGTGLNWPTDIRTSPDGSIYYIARGGFTSTNGFVYKLRYTGSQAPQITSQPASRTVFVGESATFTVVASGATSYQWQRNGVNISGATTGTYTLNNAQLTDNNARFRAVVTNSFGSTTSTEAILTVTNNQAPSAVISTPASGTTYQAGNAFSFSGSASDPENGTLPASAFSWWVDFHHDDHAHPFMAAVNGVTTGSFTTTTGGESSSNVWYRLYLKVTDSGGRSTTVFRDIMPVKSTMTFTTSPAGLQITLDGQPRTTPLDVVGVVNLQRTLGVVSPQAFNGTTYEFVSWSDGGAPTHTINTPATNRTYTATYRILPTTYLSDMTWVSATNGWGPVERDRSNGEQAAGDGRTLMLNGISYTKGLGVHAASDITYNIGGTCNWFMADIGVDDEVAGGSVIFQVFGDGVKLYDSGVMSGSTTTKQVSVNIQSRNQLRLVVTTGGDTDAEDHADWAIARVNCGPAAPVGTYLSDMTWASATNGWGPVEKDRSNGEQAAGDGTTITIRGTAHAKGLGVHAQSDITYNLGGLCSTLLADIGIDDEVAATTAASVIFQVWNGTTKLYDSGILTRSSAVVPISVNISSVQTLRLTVTDAGNGNGSDHADWGSARVVCNSIPPTPTPTPSVPTNTPSGATNTPTAVTISSLSAKDTANAADWSIQSNMSVGMNVYGDRTFTFATVPPSVAGAAWIRTANDSKVATPNPLVTFNINRQANVYVAKDDRVARPAWMDSTWVDTGENITIGGDASNPVYSVFRKQFPAGQVALGPNGTNSAASMYLIAVR